MIDQEIVKVLESVANEEGICNYKIEMTKSGVKGDGHLGLVKEVVLIGKDDKNEDKALNLIVKRASNNDMLRNQAPLEILYRREMYVYDTLLPAFNHLEIKKGLVQSVFGPKFYKGNLTYKNEVLILENLKQSGFQLYDRKKTMNTDHLNLVIAEYGHLHALSFALRDQKLDKFNTTVGSMDDVSLEFAKKTKFIEMMIHHSIKAKAALNTKTHKEIIKVYETFISGIQQFLDDLPKYTDKYSVALHGDCWTNNMLFKYEDDDHKTKPTKVCFIDFQLSRLGPPVLDLAYFFYTCSSKDSLDNLDYYLNLYYNSLSSYLLKFGSDPEKLYPFSVLKQQWTRYARYGLILATYIIHVALSETEESVDLADVAESGVDVKDAFNYEISKTDEYNKRMVDVITHFVNHNFI